MLPIQRSFLLPWAPSVVTVTAAFDDGNLHLRRPPRPGKLPCWSVPPSRDHDDLLISTALTARLDEIDWRDRTARGRAGS